MAHVAAGTRTSVAAHDTDAVTDALLIDDRIDNCEAFRNHGGSTIQWKMGKNDITEVDAALDHWLSRPAPATGQAAAYPDIRLEPALAVPP